ncbi:MAG: MFS transporter [Candidatus Mcinerneyibacterium aminivorans]|uniref:MFS transporter n=1 Tax=Candidatus Mcinerneyibacterium aminivorans TaxID=2703815 RepID=A0A5D0MJE9_9BACT|nr:MAG: MFS transporter [Candidatus Mcinerneyibacterium aminivorans]
MTDNNKSIYLKIKKDLQIWKFSFYGFFKNLRFFEPYLYIYLLNLNFSLFHIGLLFAIRETTIYILEVPSGVFADNYGRKTSLLICFISYIISFILFFFVASFFLASIAMFFFGIGEAFRSGTHKSIIYSYLERKGWFDHKTFVYGRTRSFSLIGTSISAFLSIFLVLNIPSMKWIFIITIFPYILDFILIVSYPSYLNEKSGAKFSFDKFIQLTFSQLKNLFQSIKTTKILLSSSIFDSIFKSSKDYIQPVLKNIIGAAGVYILTSYSAEENMKIILGLTYGIFYIFNSIASRNAYRVQKRISSYNYIYYSFYLMGIIFVLLSLLINLKITILVIALFFIFSFIRNIRKPMIVDVFGNMVKTTQRATIHSVDSQLRSILKIFIAPALGFLSDTFSIPFAFLSFGIILLFTNIFLKIKTIQ